VGDFVLGKTISHYKILEKLGEGGMGEVYLAEDTKLDRKVALKFLPEEMQQDPTARKRLLREAKSAAALDHPYICKIYEVGEAEDKSFISMEYIQGQTLRDRLAEGPLSVKEALQKALEVAEALEGAHKQNIVHRDLKPSNIMLTPESHLKVMDFGLAKRFIPAPGIGIEENTKSQPLTKTGMTPGTPSYMSPEQIRAKAVDPRSDVFSFGILLYEMLTGVHPFRRSSPMDTVSAILNDPPPPLSRYTEELPELLQHTVRKILAKDPNHRYQSIHEVWTNLNELLFETSPSEEVSPEPQTVSAVSPSAPAAAPRSERRQATIVYSNLAGYTSMMEQLDPQEVDRVIDRIKIMATDAVQNHGGVIHHLGTDELVALFGIPSTHEDDFLRAVRAAFELHAGVREVSLELESRVGRRIRMRTGINSGRLVVQWSQGGEFRISGSVLQLAAQLVVQAEDDEVLVSPETRQLIEAFFETEAREPFVLRDRTQPITPYQVVRESGFQTRLEATERLGLTPYTGRQKELDTLKSCLQKALSGKGQFVTVVGEAGVGKSRLLYEFRQALDKEAFELLQVQCQSYGGTIPYLPFIQALREGLHIGEDELDPALLQRIVGRIRDIDRELEDFIPLYLHLLSIQNEEFPLPKHLEGDDLRVALTEGLCAIFTLCSKQGPTVMLLEDWHWADEASRDVLTQLVGIVPAHPLLLVLTYRPEYSQDWGSVDCHTPIHLGPLEALLSITIMKSVLGAKSFPPKLGNLIHERTGGNPLFIEEVCRTLQEEGVLKVENKRAVVTGSLEKLSLPATVQAVIGARLDRLDVHTHELALNASVIGQEFSRRILERILADTTRLSQSLEGLKALGLIQQIRVVPEAVHRFKHVLTQEVAYERLLPHQLKNLHRAVGQAIEAIYPDRIDEQLSLLANHFSRAEDWQKAVHYGMESARRANSLAQFTQALDILEMTKEWVLKLPQGQTQHEARVEILMQQERICDNLGLRDRQRLLIDQLLALLEQIGDRTRLPGVYIRQADLYTLLGCYEDAENTLSKSLSLVRTLSDTIGQRNTLRSAGFLQWHQENYQDAVANIEAALAIDRKLEDADGCVMDLANLASVLRSTGDHERALTCLEEARQINQTVQNPVRLPVILHNISGIHRDQGHLDEALTYSRQGYEAAKQVRGDVFQPAISMAAIAGILWDQGKIDESLGQYRELIQVTRDTHNLRELSAALRTLGQLLFTLGKSEEALSCLLESTELLARLEDHQNEALAWSTIAAIHEQNRDGHQDAKAAWEKVRALRKAAKDRPGELEALEGIARIARQQEAGSSLALSYYQEACELVEDIGDRKKQGDLLNTMGILEWNRGDYTQALAHYEHALGIFQELDDAVQAAVMLNSIGKTLKDLRRYEEALVRLQEALDIDRETGQQLLEGHALAILGDVYSETGELQRALEHYQESLRIRREIGDKKGEGWMLHRLAEAYVAQDSLDFARRYLTQALTIAEECENRKLQDACTQLTNSLS